MIIKGSMFVPWNPSGDENYRRVDNVRGDNEKRNFSTRERRWTKDLYINELVNNIMPVVSHRPGPRFLFRCHSKSTHLIC